MRIKKRLHKPGQGSTGPKTDEGKEAASRNSTTHGCAAKKHFILPTESHAEYDKLEAGYFEEYLPLGPMDESFILRVAELEWVRNRCDRHLQNARTDLLLTSADPRNWNAEDHKGLDLLEKYFKNADRAWRNAWRDLQSIRRDRLQNLTAHQKIITAMHYNVHKLGIAEIELFPYPGLPDNPVEAAPTIPVPKTNP